MPSSPGDCDEYEQRWFFDSVEGQCKSFVYGGCGGNQNNFGSIEECENYCGNRKKIPTEEEFLTESCFLEQHQGNCDDYQAYWYYDSQDGVCKQLLYSGCGGNKNHFKTHQECENKCGEAQDICQLPLVVGPCSGSFRQYYYDGATSQCYEFDYGGCQGNKNRFDSMRLCQQRCQKTQVTTPSYTVPDEGTHVERPTSELSEICKLPVDSGPCQSAVPSWYYDAQAGRCVGFSYSGCAGNANHFQSVELCERQCGIYRDQDVCNLPVDSGPCGEALRKWHYDPYQRICRSFAYSGCEGTGNRFSTEQECEAECVYHDAILPGGNGTQETQTMICELSSNGGPCSEGYKRWQFSKEHGTCVMFLYGGCGGNLNRFKTFNACTEFCASAIEKYRRITLRAVIRLNSTEFPPHSTVRIPCEVRGVPVPVTTWFKGDNQITDPRKYTIEEDSTLVITDAEVGDSGQYKCHVQNEYGTADSSTVITIKGIYVHPTCTDNPFFANCKLIVRANYCTNKYYARFCCRSCTLDGQLPSQGPHLTHRKKRK